MADNVAITAGAGTTVATDDVAGVHYQKVKVAVGAADAATLISAGAGAADAGTIRVTMDTGQVASLGQAAMAASMPVVVASDQSRLPVATPITEKFVTLTVDTGAFVAHDVMATTQAVDAFFRATDGSAIIHSVTVVDIEDQTPYDFDIIFMATSTSIGTENSAISISAANAALGGAKTVTFSSTDAKDWINSRVYGRHGMNIPVKAISGTDDLGIAMVCRSGTPTHAGGNITCVIGYTQS
jgi:hypothetical protein